MEREDAPYSYRLMPSSVNRGSRMESWLLRGPIFFAAVFGSVFMIRRFILVLSEDLKQRPENWGAVLILTVLVGTVSLVVIVACTVVGAAVGLILTSLARRVSGWDSRGTRPKRHTRHALHWDA